MGTVRVLTNSPALLRSLCESIGLPAAQAVPFLSLPSMPALSVPVFLAQHLGSSLNCSGHLPTEVAGAAVCRHHWPGTAPWTSLWLLLVGAGQGGAAAPQLPCPPRCIEELLSEVGRREHSDARREDTGQPWGAPG